MMHYTTLFITKGVCIGSMIAALCTLKRYNTSCNVHSHFQVRILPVTDEFRDSAEKVAQKMQNVGIRAQVSILIVTFFSFHL